MTYRSMSNKVREVKLRLLKREDAYVSVAWRNDPEVFRFTGNTYDHEITIENELEWIDKVITRDCERRYAIEADGKYIGNIYLTDIEKGSARYHIFIGDKQYWGKGVASRASKELLDIAFNELNLNKVSLKVNRQNFSAVRLYERLGFKEIDGSDAEWMGMECLNPHSSKDYIGRYIFLTSAVSGVGGGQLYLSAKIRWLEEEGWEVRVIYISKGEIVLPDLKRFENGWSPELQYRFSSYSSTARKAAAIRMLGATSLPQNVVIESYSYETALWGEYMASLCGGKHIFYLLLEPKQTTTPSMEKFLRYKLSQNLIYGITPQNIPAILPEADPDATFLRAEGCSQFNAPDIDDSRLEDISSNGFTILSIGRLEKAYMEDMVREVVSFSASCKDPVNFVMIGDTPDLEKKERLLDLLRSAKNLRLNYWGYTFPIPRKLYEKADVFVGCAGSARTAFKERTPVITIDALDHQGIGLLGETTRNTLYRNDSEPQIEVNLLLQRVYNERLERREARKSLPVIMEKVDFTRHKEIIDMPYDKQYYPVEKVSNGLLFDLGYRCLKLIGGRYAISRIKSMKKILHFRK